MPGTLVHPSTNWNFDQYGTRWFVELVWSTHRNKKIWSLQTNKGWESKVEIMFHYVPFALISNDFNPRGITGKFVLHCTLRQTFDGVMLFWYGNFKVNSKRQRYFVPPNKKLVFCILITTKDYGTWFITLGLSAFITRLITCNN